MPAETVEQYTEQRAHLLARLVLTRRKDLRVYSLNEAEDVGIDMIVHIAKEIPGLPANPYFGVQIKGTSSSLENEAAASRIGQQAARAVQARAFILAPIVLLVFSMEEDRGYWGWVMEPSVDGPQSPSLTRTDRMEMQRITKQSTESLVECVTAWFEAMGRVFLRGKEEKGSK